MIAVVDDAYVSAMESLAPNYRSAAMVSVMLEAAGDHVTVGRLSAYLGVSRDTIERARRAIWKACERHAAPMPQWCRTSAAPRGARSNVSAILKPNTDAAPVPHPPLPLHTGAPTRDGRATPSLYNEDQQQAIAGAAAAIRGVGVQGHVVDELAAKWGGDPPGLQQRIARARQEASTNPAGLLRKMLTDDQPETPASRQSALRAQYGLPEPRIYGPSAYDRATVVSWEPLDDPPHRLSPQDEYQHGSSVPFSTIAEMRESRWFQTAPPPRQQELIEQAEQATASSVSHYHPNINPKGTT